MATVTRIHPQNKANLGTGNLKNLNTEYLKTAKTMTDLGNPNDESIIDLQLEKAAATIDYDKMKESVQNTHATKPNGTYYKCGEACWNFNPGHHSCVKSSEKTDLTKFGVGVILYFKFVKHLIFFFFIFTILSIPAYIFYTSSFKAYNSGSNESLTYIDLLMATTVGSIGLGSTSCSVGQYSTTSVATTDEKQKDQLYFNCPTGTIASVDNIVYGLVTRGTTCSFLDTTDLDTSCNKLDITTSQLQTVFNGCVDSSSCTIASPTTLFKTGDATCNTLYQNLNIYARVACKAETITVFNKYEVAKSTIAFIVAGFDAFIIIIFLIMIYTLQYAQKSSTENVQKKAYSASSYTIELRNLPQDMPAEELAAKLWAFLDNKLGPKSVQAGHRVVDVQIVLPNRLIDYSKQVGSLIHAKNNLIRDFMQDYVPSFNNPTIDFNGLQALMQDLTTQNHPKLKQAEKDFKKIRDMAFKKMKLLGEIQKLKTTKAPRIVAAFVTFSSMAARNRMLDSFVSSPLDRIARVLCSCYYDKNVEFYGKILRGRNPADPGSILWENLGEPGPKITVRRTISALITVLLWVASAGILLVSTYYKNNFKKAFPEVDCTGLNPSKNEAGNDYLLGDYQVGLLQCYCQTDLIGRLNDVFPTVNDSTLCLTWFTDKAVETSITFAIVFVVLVINYLVQFVFQGLSKFEKHSTLNKQLALRVIKTFVGQFLNTGVMILIVNAKLDISFWQGQFRDLPPLWYENVGSTLLSTMCINIITVPTIKIIFVLFNRIARLCDRGCGSDARKTKKKTQAAYVELYSGPEFIIDFRYSQILTLTFVCFLYSSGMPLLYLSSFLQLVLTYFFDKVLLLRISKIPKNYDEKLEAVVRPTLYIVLVAHLVFAIFMFGQNQIFSQSSGVFSAVTDAVTSVTNNIAEGNKNIASKFFKRSVLDYNFVLLLLLIAILVLYLVKGVLLGFLKRTLFAIFMKDEEKAEKQGSGGRKVAPLSLANFTFFYVIKAEDIAKLIQLTKVTIKATQNQELINQLKAKLVLLKHEYKAKMQPGNVSTVNFIGFYTYDVRLHPDYSAQFAIEEMLDDENLD